MEGVTIVTGISAAGKSTVSPEETVDEIIARADESVI
jgi:adenylylsulfate kinase-like enzyme